MEKLSKYAIVYLDAEGEQWTFTSCYFFPDRQAALDYFPYKNVRVLLTIKVTLK